jgi:transcriptional regulator with XRE-family HTH domain
MPKRTQPQEKWIIRKVSETIRATRISKGLSQQQVAERANLNPESLSRLENAKTSPSVETLYAVVRHGLGESMATFFQRVEAGERSTRPLLSEIVDLLSERKSPTLRLVRAIVVAVLREQDRKQGRTDDSGA